MTLTIPYDSGRIAILSDLHADTYQRRGADPITSLGLHAIVNDSLDALIIAGDLTDGPAAKWIRGLAHLTPHIPPERIYILPGNHDYYGGTLQDDQLLAEHTQSVSAHFVQKEELLHGDTRVLCCTLWTDFDLLEDAETAMGIAGSVMRDYSRIWTDHTADSTAGIGDTWQPSASEIEPADTLAVHRDHRGWLESKLMTAHPDGEAGRTIVVTHHGPHLSVAGSVDGLTPAFHSDLTDLIERFAPAAWFIGHSHRRLRAMVGRTDVRNVSVGYCREFHVSESQYLINASIWESRRGS
ncbi:Calcineurin-like phosphoesterase [Sulfitobacter brevis]|uniref:Calcineurin-like phosphoesterase n=1 Tax=Sulfitobacter brevis TaxID=74348 RepID=A0A1I1SUN0_9RHOB|nr:metallophosphoesterase [Sulfitobacter brevis]SFD50167.1 Calcineurin-like phosphoesterase [Sulfitobacter brevis]